MAVKNVITRLIITMGVGILIAILYKLYDKFLFANERWLKRKKIHDAGYEILKLRKYPEERRKAIAVTLGYLLASFALAPFLMFVTYKFRLWTLPRDALFLEHELWAAYFLGYFFLSLLVMGIPYVMVNRLVFPHIVDQRSRDIQVGMTLRWTLIALLVLLPFIFLSFDTYTVITKEGFSRDTFFHVSEETYPFSAFDYLLVRHELRGRNFLVSIDAFLLDGKNLSLYQKSSPLLLSRMPLAALEHIRRQECVPLAIQEEPSEAFYEHFRNMPQGRRRRFDRDEEVERMRDVFRRLRAIAAMPCS